jgi:hypothetical protein
MIMPRSLQPECSHLVDIYGQAIIELFARDIEPSKVCTMIQLCEYHTLTGTVNAQDNPIMEIKKKEDNCAMCQYAIHTLFDIMQDKVKTTRLPLSNPIM